MHARVGVWGGREDEGGSPEGNKKRATTYICAKVRRVGGRLTGLTERAGRGCQPRVMATVGEGKPSSGRREWWVAGSARGGEECTDGVWLVGGDGSVGAEKKKGREREKKIGRPAICRRRRACCARLRVRMPAIGRLMRCGGEGALVLRTYRVSRPKLQRKDTCESRSAGLGYL